MSRISDDLVERIYPWWTQDFEDYVRTVGGMFSEIEAFALEPDEDDDGGELPIFLWNLVSNPSFETDALGAAPSAWLNVGGNISFVVNQAWATRGTKSLSVSTPTGMAAGTEAVARIDSGQTLYTVPAAFPTLGQVFVVRADCKITAITGSMRLMVMVEWFDHTGASLGVDMSPALANVGQDRLVGVFTAPVDAVAYVVDVAAVADADGSSMTYALDAVQVAPSADYIDGDQPGYVWTGLRGASGSQSAPQSLPDVTWAGMFDPDTCPILALPFLAQLVGERLPAGIDEAGARQWIKDNPNRIRGTKNGIARAAQRNLTGAKTVMMLPRTKLDGSAADPDYLSIRTLAAETPDPAQTLRDILSTAPAEIQISYTVVSTASWADVAATYATWSDVTASNATWADVAQTTIGAGGGWLIWTAP